MPRREFPRPVKVAVIKRATRDGVVYCEGCGAIAKKWQIDHKRADGLLGEPVLENAQLICKACYDPKNSEDTRAIAKAKRREARHIGAYTSKKTIRSAGFPARPDKPNKIIKNHLPPKEIYR
jgi:5-methylcytosine-specific restriction protein A